MAIREVLGLGKKKEQQPQDGSNVLSPEQQNKFATAMQQAGIGAVSNAQGLQPDQTAAEVMRQEQLQRMANEPPEDFKLEPTEPYPQGVEFEVGEELTPGPVFRLVKGQALLVEVLAVGHVSELRRTKRTTRTYHVQVNKLVTEQPAGTRIISRLRGELVAHPSLMPILDGRPLGECYAITATEDEGQGRYRVQRLTVQE